MKIFIESFEIFVFVRLNSTESENFNHHRKEKLSVDDHRIYFGHLKSK